MGTANRCYSVERDLAHSGGDWCFRVQLLSFRLSCWHLPGLDQQTCL